MVPLAQVRSLLVGQAEAGQESSLQVDPRSLGVLGETFLHHILVLHLGERHQGPPDRTCQAQQDLVGKAHLGTAPVELQVWRETVQERGMAWVHHLVGIDLAWKETVLVHQGWGGTVQEHLDLEGIHLGQLGLQGIGPGLRGTGLGLRDTDPGLRGTGPGLLGREEKSQGQTAQSEESQQVLLGGQCLLRMGTEGHLGPHQASQDW